MFCIIPNPPNVIPDRAATYSRRQRYYQKWQNQGQSALFMSLSSLPPCSFWTTVFAVFEPHRAAKDGTVSYRDVLGNWVKEFKMIKIYYVSPLLRWQESKLWCRIGLLLCSPWMKILLCLGRFLKIKCSIMKGVCRETLPLHLLRLPLSFFSALSVSLFILLRLFSSPPFIVACLKK